MNLIGKKYLLMRLSNCGIYISNNIYFNFENSLKYNQQIEYINSYYLKLNNK